MEETGMYIHDNAPKIGHMVAKDPTIKNGSNKPR